MIHMEMLFRPTPPKVDEVLGDRELPGLCPGVNRGWGTGHGRAVCYGGCNPSRVYHFWLHSAHTRHTHTQRVVIRYFL